MGETAARFLPWPLEGSRGTIRKVPLALFLFHLSFCRTKRKVAAGGNGKRMPAERIMVLHPGRGRAPASQPRGWYRFIVSLAVIYPSSVIRLAGDIPRTWAPRRDVRVPWRLTASPQGKPGCLLLRRTVHRRRSPSFVSRPRKEDPMGGTAAAVPPLAGRGGSGGPFGRSSWRSFDSFPIAGKGMPRRRGGL